MKANSYQDICWVSAWSYLCWWVSNKGEFWWRQLLRHSLKLSKFTSFKQNVIPMKTFLSLCLKFYNFMSFKPNRILMKIFVESQFEVIYVYEFQTKANSYENICWVSVWSNLSRRVSNNIDFLWRHLVSLSFKLRKFMRLKPWQVLMKTFFDSHFEIM